MTRIVDYEELFWQKVDASGDCWEWTAYTSKDGYGKTAINLGGGKTKKWSAHRRAWEILVGPIPAGLQLDHLCRNRKCVNPDHLEPVTPSVNVRRGSTIPITRARQRGKTHCPVGHPYDESNTNYQGPSRWRRCLACHAARERARHATKRRTA